MLQNFSSSCRSSLSYLFEECARPAMVTVDEETGAISEDAVFGVGEVRFQHFQVAGFNSNSFEDIQILTATGERKRVIPPNSVSRTTFLLPSQRASVTSKCICISTWTAMVSLMYCHDRL